MAFVTIGMVNTILYTSGCKWKIVTYFLHLSSYLERIQSSLSEIRYKRSAVKLFRENRLRKPRSCVADINKIEFTPKLWYGTTLWKWWTPWQSVSYVTERTLFSGLHTDVRKLSVLTPLTFNDPYMGRTAPLTSRYCILYIYSTNIRTEYFKHAA